MGSLEGVAGIGGTTAEVADDGTCPTGNNNWGRMLSSRIFGLNDTNTSNISGTTYACIPDADYLRGDILVIRYQAPWVVGGTDYGKLRCQPAVPAHLTEPGNPVQGQRRSQPE